MLLKKCLLLYSQVACASIASRVTICGLFVYHLQYMKTNYNCFLYSYYLTGTKNVEMLKYARKGGKKSLFLYWNCTLLLCCSMLLMGTTICRHSVRSTPSRKAKLECHWFYLQMKCSLSCPSRHKYFTFTYSLHYSPPRPQIYHIPISHSGVPMVDCVSSDEIDSDSAGSLSCISGQWAPS